MTRTEQIEKLRDQYNRGLMTREEYYRELYLIVKK